MDARTSLKNLTGEFSGTNQLWLMPGTPVNESATTASVSLAVAGRCLVIRNTWSYEGKPHEGLLTVRLSEKPSPIDMVWFDSFHTGGGFMTFAGESAAEGRLAARGSYPAPEGPDWGWRITLVVESENSFRIVMDNITPDGEEALAVDALYVKSS